MSCSEVLVGQRNSFSHSKVLSTFETQKSESASGRSGMCMQVKLVEIDSIPVVLACYEDGFLFSLFFNSYAHAGRYVCGTLVQVNN